MAVKVDLTGKTFGRLFVLAEFHKKHRHGSIQWVCHCDCGNFCVLRAYQLTNEIRKDCNCGLHSRLVGNNKKHGYRNAKVYSIVDGIIRRCHDVNKDNYSDYGGRGITVCDEWRNDRGSFCDWLLEQGYREGLQVDRIDNDKGYSPENCRLLTPNFNGINKRGYGESGCCGVFFKSNCGVNPFLSTIRLFDKYYELGYFDNLLDASSFRLGVVNRLCKEASDILKKNKQVPVKELTPVLKDMVSSVINEYKTTTTIVKATSA